MKYQLIVQEYTQDQLSKALADHTLEGPAPRPLSFWRETLEKLGGYFTGPDGERVPVSFDSWNGKADTTLLSIYVTYIDPRLVGTLDPSGKS